jgi:ribosomal protein S18 acetylase RimI-like enzyme
MLTIPIDEAIRPMVNKFLIEHWHSTVMMVRGKAVDMTDTDGFAVLEDGHIAGLVTYKIENGECEIMSLDSLIENRGVGTGLLNKVISAAKSAGCRKVRLITTNDNVRAFSFYQKRGFDMSAFYRNSLEAARAIKPEIPLIGNDGIPLRHEIEFELKL